MTILETLCAAWIGFIAFVMTIALSLIVFMCGISAYETWKEFKKQK